MAYAYKHLMAPKLTGTGIADVLLFAPVSAFAVDGIKCPAPGASPAPGDQVVISEDHAFLTGEGFTKFITAPFKNQITATTTGEIGSQKLEEKLEVFIPGSYKELHEAIKNLMNTPLVVLIQDADCEEKYYYQLGCDCMFAYITAEFGTGQVNGGGQKGYKVTITYYTSAVLQYAGEVTIKPA